MLTAGRVGLWVEKLRDGWNNKDGARTLTHFKRRSEVWPGVRRRRLSPGSVSGPPRKWTDALIFVTADARKSKDAAGPA